MARKGKKPLVDCSFKCPAKGHIDFNVWPRKNETSQTACRRKLAVYVDAHQLPHCETIRIRSIGATKLNALKGTKVGRIVRER